MGVGLVLALTDMSTYVQCVHTCISSMSATHCYHVLLPRSAATFCRHALLPGTKNVVCAKQMELLKPGCVVGNMGHSNHEIDVVSTVCERACLSVCVCVCVLCASLRSCVCACVTCVCELGA